MTNEQLWHAALGELELIISKPNFTTWFKHTHVVSADDGRVVIGVPNAFTQSWLQTKYNDFIVRALEAALQKKPDVQYRVSTARPAPQAAEARQAPAPAAAPAEDFNLSPRYQLASFVVGKGNALAHAAAVAISEKPGQVYNPLFIYGGVGLGKTHLMQAIGHEVLRINPRATVLYVTCERFTTDFIHAVSRGRADQFKNRYRNVDVLLVDDVQFLAGKEGTQEEFFHTFNALHQTNRQIVVTSDRPPKSIPSLEARITSRFEWGMIADIAQPDLETRIAILEAKCKALKATIGRDILQFLATSIQSNIRELEGALNRIIAFHQLNGAPPTLESTKSLLATLSTRSPRGGLTPKQVIAVVSSYYDVPLESILGNSRKKELVLPRQISMFLMREELHSSFPNIGQELGGRDHTTAMHAVMKISRIVDQDERLRQDISLIRQRLHNL